MGGSLCAPAAREGAGALGKMGSLGHRSASKAEAKLRAGFMLMPEMGASKVM